jgi:hypothetical protein
MIFGIYHKRKIANPQYGRDAGDSITKPKRLGFQTQTANNYRFKPANIKRKLLKRKQLFDSEIRPDHPGKLAVTHRFLRRPHPNSSCRFAPR